MTRITAPSALTTLRFQEIDFDVVEIHGQAWLSLPQIEGALGYAHAGKALSNLYERNADEFNDDMTQLLELPTACGIRQTRIFSLRGAHLLGMLARTEIAKAFRRRVLNVLDGLEVPQTLAALSLNQRATFLKMRVALLKELQRITGPAQLAFAWELYENLRQVSRLLGMTPWPLEDIAPALRQQVLPGAA